jgi:hypothetical protein
VERRALRLQSPLLAAVALACASAFAQSLVQLDPFAQATRGDPACPAQPPPLITPQEARVEAHVRAERGTRCALEGTCEPGGAYRRDPEINARVRDLIAADRRFADTSVWVTTSRGWVTLQGCVHGGAQRRSLVSLVSHATRVERVFDELKVTRAPAKH